MCTFTLQNSTLIDNFVNLTGGAVYLNLRLLPSNVRPYLSLQRCSFTQNRAEMQGGAVAVWGRTSGRINNSSFARNVALSGGAIYVSTSDLSEDRQIRIQRVHFWINNATVIGQALYCYGSVYIEDVRVWNRHATAVGDVYLEGYNMTLGKIKLEVEKVKGTVQSNMEYTGLTVAASQITLSQSIHSMCPKSFLVDQHAIVTRKNAMLHIQCQSCPPFHYTIVNPTLVVSNMSRSYSSRSRDVKCSPCPLGGICDGEVRSLDNYWATNVTTKVCISSFDLYKSSCIIVVGKVCVVHSSCTNGQRSF